MRRWASARQTTVLLTTRPQCRARRRPATQSRCRAATAAWFHAAVRAWSPRPFRTTQTTVGSCGHDCVPGGCSGGACLPWVVARPPTTLKPVSIASDGTSLVWADEGVGAILQVSTTGGSTAMQLAADSSFGEIAGLSLAQGYVVWATDDDPAAVWTARVGQPASGTLTRWAPPGDTVPLPTLSGTATHAALLVGSAPRAGCEHVRDPDRALRLRARVQFVRRRREPWGWIPGALRRSCERHDVLLRRPQCRDRRVRLRLELLRELPYGGELTGLLALDAVNLYIGNSTFFATASTIDRVAQAGGSSTSIATGIPGTLSALTSDGVNVYFTYAVLQMGADGGESIGPYGLGFAPVDASGGFTALSVAGKPTQVIAAGGSIFWIDQATNTISACMRREAYARLSPYSRISTKEKSAEGWTLPRRSCVRASLAEPRASHAAGDETAAEALGERVEGRALRLVVTRDGRAASRARVCVDRAECRATACDRERAAALELGARVDATFVRGGPAAAARGAAARRRPAAAAGRGARITEAR